MNAPICPQCGKPIIFLNPQNGQRIYCSNACAKKFNNLRQMERIANDPEFAARLRERKIRSRAESNQKAKAEEAWRRILSCVDPITHRYKNPGGTK